MRSRLVLALILAVLCSGAAWADMLSFDLGNTFSGTPPAGDPPWLKAQFTSSTAGTVTLTLSSLLQGATEFVTEWDFNITADFNFADLTVNQDSGPTAAITFGENCCKADGDGKYDIQLLFPSSLADRFDDHDVAVFTFTAPGITAGSFNYLSKDSGGSGPFYTAAHVQGIATGEGSGWISEGGAPPAEVPEPASLALIGIGLLVAGSLHRRRRGKVV